MVRPAKRWKVHVHVFVYEYMAPTWLMTRVSEVSVKGGLNAIVSLKIYI